jgi:hypothetical protein
MPSPTPRRPKGHIQADGSFVCPHRDVSCCPGCLSADERLVDVYGQVFYIPSASEREELARDMAATR